MNEQHLQSRQEYAEYMHNRIIDKLKKSNNYELLSFAILSMELVLRQSDLINLKWSQIDFNSKMLTDVELVKESNQSKRLIKHDFHLTDSAILILKEWKNRNNSDNMIFPNYNGFKRYTISKRIGELIGSHTFNTHELRSIGIALKYSK